jgi:hypothetical protein
MRPVPVLSSSLFFAFLLATADARAFCRTTTCPLPPDFTPSPGACYPQDFAHYCASLSTPVKPLPIWWRNACVSYDLQKNGTRQIAYDTVAHTVAAAFAKWTSVSCPTSGSASRVSVDVRDLGPVDCNRVQYNSDQGNQHVIIFDDDIWPHNDANNTLGLTTVTYDPETGEMYDADMEINATVPLSIVDPVPPAGYDFESIITHETGHFLGMAHSGDERATMFAHYSPGTSTMRVLTDDDVKGICTIYPPGGIRTVDVSVPGANASGQMPETTCDPTPRHGFSTECASTPSKSCIASVAMSGGDPQRTGEPPSGLWMAAAGGFLGLTLRASRLHRRRRRPPRSRQDG